MSKELRYGSEPRLKQLGVENAHRSVRLRPRWERHKRHSESDCGERPSSMPELPRSYSYVRLVHVDVGRERGRECVCGGGTKGGEGGDEGDRQCATRTITRADRTSPPRARAPSAPCGTRRDAPLLELAPNARRSCLLHQVALFNDRDLLPLELFHIDSLEPGRHRGPCQAEERPVELPQWDNY